MDPYVRVECSLVEWIDLLGDAAVLVEYQQQKGGVTMHAMLLAAVSMAMAARDSDHEDHDAAKQAIKGARTLEAVREGQEAVRH